MSTMTQLAISFSTQGIAFGVKMTRPFGIKVVTTQRVGDGRIKKYGRGFTWSRLAEAPSLVNFAKVIGCTYAYLVTECAARLSSIGASIIGACSKRNRS